MLSRCGSHAVCAANLTFKPFVVSFGEFWVLGIKNLIGKIIPIEQLSL